MMDELVERAMRFAFDAHNAIEHRRRYTNEPYTNHLEAVADMVSSVVADPRMIAAAYLHDTVEDTAVTLDQISEEFGEDVAYLVVYLTDMSERRDGNRAARKAIDREHVARGDHRVHTIKLADLISNAESITEHDPRFARVFMGEMKLLLPLLKGGDRSLFERASALVDAWFETQM